MVPDVQPGGAVEAHPGFGVPDRIRGPHPAHHNPVDARIVERREERGRRIEEPAPGDRRPLPDQIGAPLPAGGGRLFEEAEAHGSGRFDVDRAGALPCGGRCSLEGIDVDRDRWGPGCAARSCRACHPFDRCLDPLPGCMHRIRPRAPCGEHGLPDSL